MNSKKELAQNAVGLAGYFRKEGRLNEAEILYREAIRHYESEKTEEWNVTRWEEEGKLISAYHEFAWVLMEKNQQNQVLGILKKARSRQFLMASVLSEIPEEMHFIWIQEVVEDYMIQAAIHLLEGGCFECVRRLLEAKELMESAKQMEKNAGVRYDRLKERLNAALAEGYGELANYMQIGDCRNERDKNVYQLYRKKALELWESIIEKPECEVNYCLIYAEQLQKAADSCEKECLKYDLNMSAVSEALWQEKEYLEKALDIIRKYANGKDTIRLILRLTEVLTQPDLFFENDEEKNICQKQLEHLYQEAVLTGKTLNDTDGEIQRMMIKIYNRQSMWNLKNRRYRQFTDSMENWGNYLGKYLSGGLKNEIKEKLTNGKLFTRNARDTVSCICRKCV